MSHSAGRGHGNRTRHHRRRCTASAKACRHWSTLFQSLLSRFTPQVPHGNNNKNNKQIMAAMTAIHGEDRGRTGHLLACGPCPLSLFHHLSASQFMPCMTFVNEQMARPAQFANMLRPIWFLQNPFHLSDITTRDKSPATPTTLPGFRLAQGSIPWPRRSVASTIARNHRCEKWELDSPTGADRQVLQQPVGAPLTKSCPVRFRDAEGGKHEHGMLEER